MPLTRSLRKTQEHAIGILTENLRKNGNPGGDDDTSDGGAVDDRTSAEDTVNDACLDEEVTGDAPQELMQVLTEAAWNRNSGDACWDPVPAGDVPDTRRSFGANGAWDCGMMPVDAEQYPLTMTSPPHRSASPRRGGALDDAANDSLTEMRTWVATL